MLNLFRLADSAKITINPPEANKNVDFNWEIKIHMRDGVHLNATIYKWLAKQPRRAAITVGLIALGFGLLAVFSKSLFAIPARLFATSMPTFTSTPGKTSTPMFTATPSNTPTPTFTATPLPDEITDEKGVSMRLVPAGEFTMGTSDRDIDEKPVHTVYLDAFYMDKYEVTNALYAVCVNAGVCEAPKNANSRPYATYYANSDFNSYTDFYDHPVIYVDWNMAKAYCEWRSSRLPTEAEWEKAARGTDARIYPWGDRRPNYSLLAHNYTTYNLNQEYGAWYPAKVGSYVNGKSPYGIYDMAGNVWEWVNDWYNENYYLNSPSSNPLGPDTGVYRVMRGGGWNNSDGEVRSANRSQEGYWGKPTNTNVDIGFRCARSISP